MKKWIKRGIPALVAALLLLTGCAAQPRETTAPTQEATVPAFLSGVAEKPKNNDPDAWKANMLMTASDDGSVFGSDHARSEIRTAIFVNNFPEIMPETAWDASAAGDGSVIAWVEPGEEGYTLFLAGDGGINGARACHMLFMNYDNLERVSFNGCFHTEETEDMRYMFHQCKKLRQVDIETLDTARVTNMYSMFSHCESLTALDLSGFNTANVTDMTNLFFGCSSLADLNVSRFDTANVTSMRGMFAECAAIGSLDLGSFHTGKVEDMNSMFLNCKSLEELDISWFSTGMVRDMGKMFYGTDALTSLDITRFNFSNVTEYTDFMDPGVTYDDEPWENLFA